MFHVKHSYLKLAIDHAKKEAHGPAARRDCALFFLQVERDQAKRNHRYLLVYCLTELLQATGRGVQLTTLLETLVQDCPVCKDNPPLPNRGDDLVLQLVDVVSNELETRLTEPTSSLFNAMLPVDPEFEQATVPMDLFTRGR